MSKEQFDNFGKYLKYLRELRGISITQLAKLSMVSPSYISRIENGGRRAPKPDILKRMAPYLGIGYTELMIKAGYLTKNAENLWIEDEETKALFISLTEAKKALLRAVEGFSEETIFLLVKLINELINESSDDNQTEDESENHTEELSSDQIQNHDENFDSENE